MTRKGPRTRYRPKVPPPESALLTPLAKRILRAAAERCGASRSDVFETLLRLYGGTLDCSLFAQLVEFDHTHDLDQGQLVND